MDKYDNDTNSLPYFFESISAKDFHDSLNSTYLKILNFLFLVFSSPLVLQGIALSSTSIEARWPTLSSSAVTPETKSLTGYVLFYKQTEEEKYQKIGIEAGSSTNIAETIEELKKYTLERMVVCPYSENGNGIPSQPVSVRTNEDCKYCFGLNLDNSLFQVRLTMGE